MILDKCQSDTNMGHARVRLSINKWLHSNRYKETIAFYECANEYILLDYALIFITNLILACFGVA